jgi:hypothetical protein
MIMILNTQSVPITVTVTVTGGDLTFHGKPGLIWHPADNHRRHDRDVFNDRRGPPPGYRNIHGRRHGLT